MMVCINIPVHSAKYEKPTKLKKLRSASFVIQTVNVNYFSSILFADAAISLAVPSIPSVEELIAIS